jgi:hypothetical protein
MNADNLENWFRDDSIDYYYLSSRNKYLNLNF